MSGYYRRICDVCTHHFYFLTSEELYQELRRALFDRIKDKEISVRMQAATALARLQDADDEVDEKDGKTITQKLLTLLQHDPSP